MMKLFNLGEKVVVNKGEARGLAGVIIQNPPTPSHAGWYLVQLNLNAGTLWVESSSMDKVLTLPTKEKRENNIVRERGKFRVKLEDKGIIGGFGNKTLGQTVVKADSVVPKHKSFAVGDSVRIAKGVENHGGKDGIIIEVSSFGFVVRLSSSVKEVHDVWFPPSVLDLVIKKNPMTALHNIKVGDTVKVTQKYSLLFGRVGEVLEVLSSGFMVRLRSSVFNVYDDMWIPTNNLTLIKKKDSKSTSKSDGLKELIIPFFDEFEKNCNGFYSDKIEVGALVKVTYSGSKYEGMTGKVEQVGNNGIVVSLLQVEKPLNKVWFSVRQLRLLAKGEKNA